MIPEVLIQVKQEVFTMTQTPVVQQTSNLKPFYNLKPHDPPKIILVPRSIFWDGIVCYPSTHPAWICACFVLLLLNVYHQAAEIFRKNNENCNFATLLPLSTVPNYFSHIFPLILIITQCGKKKKK